MNSHDREAVGAFLPITLAIDKHSINCTYIL